MLTYKQWRDETQSLELKAESATDLELIFLEFVNRGAQKEHVNVQVRLERFSEPWELLNKGQKPQQCYALQ